MNIISLNELKEKLDKGEDFKLVMVSDKESFNKKHLPRSINASNVQEGLSQIEKKDSIVLYGCNSNCSVTKAAVQLLEVCGFMEVAYYSGGIDDWEAAGYPLEGDYV